MKSMRRIFLILTLLLPVTVLVSSASLAATKVEATIFSYDGKDFVRTQTTLSAEGQSATDTKLDRDSSAYKALVKKRSYTGPVTLFGHDYKAAYAPLTGEDGELTGALFVGVPK
jgi:methyl-accepting chemotaxis protein